MKKLSIILVVLTLALAMIGQVFAAVDAVSGTDVSGTNVSGTNVSGTDVKCGDLDGDKFINASDALLVLKAAVDKIELTDAQLAVADTYQDGLINASDALQILKFAVKKLDTLPVIPVAPVVTGTDVTPTEA